MKRAIPESRLHLMFVLLGLALAAAGAGGLWLPGAEWWLRVPAGVLLFMGGALTVAGILVRIGWGGERIERRYPWPGEDRPPEDHSSSR